MKKYLIAALSAGALMTLMPAANAMPLASGTSFAGSDIALVAQGCGPGFARGPYGGCRPMGGFGPRFVRPGYGYGRPGYGYGRPGYGRPMYPRARPYGYRPY